MTEPREQPCDIPIQEALLGSLLLDNSLIDIAAAELEPEHFFDGLHQRIFQFTVHLATEGSVTPLILHRVMKHDSGLKEVGGLEYLANLIGAAPAIPNVRDWARILRELATRRGLIRIGEDLVNAAYDGPAESPAQVIADGAMESLLHAGQSNPKPVMSAYDTAMESLKEAERIATGQAVALVKTGLRKLDEEIGGLRGGDLIIVPAKSGQGKSAFLGCLALNTARAGVPTLVFSLEMTRRQWVERMICDIDFDTAEKPMWYSRIRNGRMSQDEFTRFAAAMQVLHDLPIEIIDDDSLTIQQIASRARAFKAKHGGALGFCALDYLQIVNPGDTRGQNREQTVNGMARALKSLAKMLGWPVAAGSQMNEGAEGRAKDERRPQASDVRESKGIMNEADLMLSPYRLAWFVENRKPTDGLAGGPEWAAWRSELTACLHRFELLGLKNRHGRRFDLELHCEMGASAIRDEAPYRPSSSDQAAQDLLGYKASA